MKTLTELRREFKDYYFDRDAANRVIRFFEKELTHQIGDKRGQPFKLEQWQRYILRHFYGWKHRVTGLRKYVVLYLEIPRKNGKSILAAGLSLYHLDADREPAARVVNFASDENQAREAVFNVAKEMVFSNPKMAQRITCYRNSMASMQSASNLQLLSGTRRGKHGKNISAMIGDEVHEWEDREVMDALRTSMATRSQRVEIYLTTAGFDKNSLCWEMHEYAVRVNESTYGDPEYDPSFMGVIYAADPEDDWTSEEVWKKANPNLGISVQLSYLRDECEKAKRMPSYENVFKRLHLNIWTEQDSRWMPIELWDSCELVFDEEELLGDECWLGIDLATTTDIAALVALFPRPNNRWRILPYFFLPTDAIERRKKERVNYEVWVKQGLIETTPGAVLDFEAIRNKVKWLGDKFQVKDIAMDRWNAVQLGTQLMNDGREVIFFGQTMSALAAPTKELSSLVMSKRIEHNGNKVMRWMVKNVAVDQDSNGNIRISRKKSKEKIDGVAALVNALGRAIVVQETGPSIYESRGVRTT